MIDRTEKIGRALRVYRHTLMPPPARFPEWCFHHIALAASVIARIVRGLYYSHWPAICTLDAAKIFLDAFNPESASNMRVPVLKQGPYIIASIQSTLTDDDLTQLRDDLAASVGKYRSKGVIVDVTVLDVMDSFATRMLRDLAQMVRLRGARTAIVGIQAEIALAMVQLGLELGDVATVLDLEEALQLLRNEA